MAKSRKLETDLETIAHLRDRLRDYATTSDGDQLNDILQLLRSMLNSKFAIAVAHTTKLITEYELTPLIPDLVTAFDRFFINPVDTDPNCHAKAGMIDTLYHLNYNDAAPFLKGIRHVQMEPVWGGKVDTAPKLRGLSAMGLVRMNYPHVMVELADLLADPESPARLSAAQAIGYSESRAGLPLLRLRAKIGDEPPVLSECFAAMLKIDPDESIDFIAPFLNHTQPQTQELTALVLGESHLPAAFPLLKRWWQTSSDPELRQTGLLAIAMLRSTESLDFLVALIASGRELDARHAIGALNLYRQDASIWQRVATAVEQRREPELLRLIC